jgi:hypothetical protein
MFNQDIKRDKWNNNYNQKNHLILYNSSIDYFYKKRPILHEYSKTNTRSTN